MANLSLVSASVTAVSLCVAFGTACSDSGSDDSGEPMVIDVNGGTVTDGGGATSVEIPPGALGAPTPIAVTRVDATSLVALPTGLTRSGDAYSFTPHGTNFAVPVTIRLPYRGSMQDSTNRLRVVRLSDDNDLSWEVVPGASFANGVATLQAVQFSILVVVSVETILQTTVEVAWAGPGRVAPNLSGVDCSGGSPCTFVVSDVSVTLQASPEGDGAGLVRWIGSDCSGLTCALTLEGNPVVVEARFGWQLSTDRLASLPTESVEGSVSSTPAGIQVSYADLSGSRSAFFEPGTEVTLTANTGAGTNLAAWGGDCAATDDATRCTVTMDGPRVARFAMCQCEPITILVDGAAEITSTPTNLLGTSCQREGCSDPERCTLWFNRDETVILQATASTKGLGWQFDTGWTGAGCSGTGTCSVMANEPREVTAGLTYPVSFASDIYEGILQSAGDNCVFCHNPDPPAIGVEAAQTGLLFSLTATAARDQIVNEPAQGACARALGEAKRINETNVADSLMLRYPLPEGQNDCDNHGLLSAFLSTTDENYVALFDWISGGCPSN